MVNNSVQRMLYESAHIVKQKNHSIPVHDVCMKKYDFEKAPHVRSALLLLLLLLLLPCFPIQKKPPKKATVRSAPFACNNPLSFRLALPVNRITSKKNYILF